MVGTPLYVAPEVLLRQPYGCAADMWSLGVIVHILLTGYPPFDDDDLVQLFNKFKTTIVRLDGRAWRAISADACDFVARLLERDVNRRLTANQALAHPWISAPRPLPFPTPPMPSQKPQQQLTNHAAPRHDGAMPLVFAQVNLQEFIRRKEFKRRESEHSDYNLKISMLVSLSEKSLKISDSSKVLDASTGISPRKVVEPNAEMQSVDTSALAANLEEKREAGSTDQLRSKSTKKKKSKKETLTMSREDTELDKQHYHQLEHERLERRRLRILAMLRRHKKQGRKSEETSGETASVHFETLSSHSSPSNHEDHHHDPLILTNSGFSDDNDSLPLLEEFPSRRDAGAGYDMDTTQK